MAGTTGYGSNGMILPMRLTPTTTSNAQNGSGTTLYRPPQATAPQWQPPNTTYTSPNGQTQGTNGSTIDQEDSGAFNTPGMGGGSFPAMPTGGGYTPRAGNMPPMQPAQYSPPPSPHLTTSITRRNVMDSAPLLASAQGYAGQSMANNMPSGDPAIQQLMRDNMQGQMTGAGMEFDRMAGAANQKHLLGTQAAAAGDIGSKLSMAQSQYGDQLRNEAFQRNQILALLGAYA